jgi:hypothetical protein
LNRGRLDVIADKDVVRGVNLSGFQVGLDHQPIDITITSIDPSAPFTTTVHCPSTDVGSNNWSITMDHTLAASLANGTYT